ncbi:hypothetical protein BBF96_13730 [Anoxybacter fermentans]|uniref:ABC transporter permease n=1 Tax=Anoxybacter fermentans TaxID=1323375 RepID=A0A3Q9HS51_9FIRM|nr:ABC-2 family transporter protein [Anoxybacter fermentans]AZR74354.1 hypothetical protein BBF96_13730 [Anoxybacter fermentans]
MRYIQLYFHLISINLRSQMQYRVSFVFSLLVVFLTYSVEFITIMFALDKFGGIRGWSLYQVAFMYGIVTVAYALARIMFCGFQRFPNMVKWGMVDRFLIRPIDERFQLVAYELPLNRLGQVILGIIVLIFAIIHLDIKPGLSNILFLVVTILSGTLLYGALFIISAAIAFWAVESRELMGIMTHGTLRMISYPISIYRPILRNIVIFIIPVAFINYFPCLHFFSYDPLGFPVFFRYLGPVVSVMVFYLSLLFWDFGLKRYQSTGN